MSGNETNSSIGQIISKVRSEQGKTQQEVADGIGVKRETVNQWETGTRQIKAEHVIKLSRFFNVSADYLLGLDENPSTNPDVKSAVKYTGLSEGALGALSDTVFEVGSSEPLNIFLEAFAVSLGYQLRELSKVSDTVSNILYAIDLDIKKGGVKPICILDRLSEAEKELSLCKFDFLEFCREIPDLYNFDSLKETISARRWEFLKLCGSLYKEDYSNGEQK